MIDFLVDEPVLLVFIVVGAGAALGAIISTSFALFVPLVIEIMLRRDTVETAGPMT